MQAETYAQTSFIHFLQMALKARLKNARKSNKAKKDLNPTLAADVEKVLLVKGCTSVYALRRSTRKLGDSLEKKIQVVGQAAILRSRASW